LASGNENKSNRVIRVVHKSLISTRRSFLKWTRRERCAALRRQKLLKVQMIEGSPLVRQWAPAGPNASCLVERELGQPALVVGLNRSGIFGGSDF
jgi:hypothetical protein